VPFAASGGLADVIGSLPAAIREKGHDCRVVIPLYKTMRPELRAQLTFLTNITVDVSWRKQYCGIFTAIWCGVTYYFIDNEYYFGREGLYGFYDDCERFVFFSRAVLEMLRYIDFKPDIINGNDWQTALIPVFYQVFYKYQRAIRTSSMCSPSTTSSIRATTAVRCSTRSWASRSITWASSNTTVRST